jgi:hypothetical protein
MTGSAGRVGRTLLPDLQLYFAHRTVLVHDADRAQLVLAWLRAGKIREVTHVLLLHRPPGQLMPQDEWDLLHDYKAWMRAACDAGVNRLVAASSEHALLTPHKPYGAAKRQLEVEAAAYCNGQRHYYTDRIGRVPDPNLAEDPDPTEAVPLTAPGMLRARIRGLLGLPRAPY